VSDLSNYPEDLIEEFNPESYLKSICIDTKIEIYAFSNIQFPVGWKEIVETLVQSIKGYAIDIVSITDYHAMLEVVFKVRKTTKEVNVWRAIDSARIESKRSCVQCGSRKSTKAPLKEHLLCEDCANSAAKLGRTGTWLDKY
jgi:hypothetical protein